MKRRGYTIVEVMVTVAISGILLIVLGKAVGLSDDAVRKSTGNYDCSATLKKAARRLQQDISQTSGQKILIGAIGGTISDGDAICVLSSKDGTGVGQFDTSGGPKWVRNIVYYCITPQSHDSYAGTTCSTAVGPWQADDHCPHKILIRQEIDLPDTPVGNPDPEQLLTPSELQSAIIAPLGTDLSPIRAQANCRKAEILGTQMLGMKISRNSAGVQIELVAVDLARANREIRVGQTSLYSSSYVQSYQFSISPEMP